MKSCRTKMCAMLIWLQLSFLVMTPQSSSAQALKVGFYRESCPSAERVVRKEVRKAVGANPVLAAGLIRLLFHDCFVTGCDGSILLQSTPGNHSEQDHPANGVTLRGFEVIDAAKAKLEARCPGTVSCADILAFAARDSSKMVGGISYPVAGGRRDATASLLSSVGNNLPPPIANVQLLIDHFTIKGMTVTEMVALTGAHSIGVAHCAFFQSRLYSFNGTANAQDPTLDAKYAAFLKTRCPNPATSRNTNANTNTNTLGGEVNLDVGTPYSLDTQFYKNLKKNLGLLPSDQALASSPLTADLVKLYIDNSALWRAEFAEAMLHMSTLNVSTGAKGEIRKNCAFVN